YAVTACEQLPQERLKRFAEHRWLIARVHAVTVKLDKDPIRATANRDRRALPEPESSDGRRVRTRQLRALDVWPRQRRATAAQRHAQRALYDQATSLHVRAHTQVGPSSMCSTTTERWRTFIERIDLSRLCGIGRRRQREVGITARLGENLELVVHA